jgi:cytosine/adenosine deaminase-related metal-dependent hydrolase
VLCYEVAHRDGEAVASDGLAETERFFATLDPPSTHVCGIVGLYAMSTVGPAMLEQATAMACRFGTGRHLHVGDSEHDNEDSLATARPVCRLYVAGALSSKPLVGHPVHVTVASSRYRVA